MDSAAQYPPISHNSQRRIPLDSDGASTLDIIDWGVRQAHVSAVLTSPICGPPGGFKTGIPRFSDGRCPDIITGSATQKTCHYDRCTSVITVNDWDGAPIRHLPGLNGNITNTYEPKDERPSTVFLEGTTDTERWLDQTYFSFHTPGRSIIGRITYPAPGTEEVARGQQPHARLDGRFSGHIKAVHSITSPELSVPSEALQRDVISKFTDISLSLETATNEAEMTERFRQATGLSHGHFRGLTTDEKSILVESQPPLGSFNRSFWLNHPHEFGVVVSTGRLRFNAARSILVDENDRWAKETLSKMYGGSAGLAVTCLSTVMAEGEVISTQEPEEPPFPVVRGPFGSLGSPVQLVPPPPPPPPPDFLGSMELVPSRLPTESSPAWADQLSGASQSEDMTANHNISELLGATHIQPTGTAPSSDQGRPTISVDDHSTAITEHVSQASALALTPRSVDTPGQIGSKSHTGQRSATASSRRQSGTPEMSGSSEPRRRLQPGETYVNGQIRRTGWVVKRKDKKKRK